MRPSRGAVEREKRVFSNCRTAVLRGVRMTVEAIPPPVEARIFVSAVGLFGKFNSRFSHFLTIF
ncbi:hypothetical protein [Acidovorax sp. PRC11]|uniref:hypothetical protein n=1 Tax=Acidovorax sp. PRC11 TaxID=2962592 RepID=UPI0028810E19|nr:hypothetical protein [Acidovorax sp. PRC11]MDT0137462.1 hypothetical protein [Acidovorax sp. PRC11]